MGILELKNIKTEIKNSKDGFSSQWKRGRQNKKFPI